MWRVRRWVLSPHSLRDGAKGRWQEGAELSAEPALETVHMLVYE